MEALNIMRGPWQAESLTPSASAVRILDAIGQKLRRARSLEGDENE
jgi:hypothetical protein